MGEEEEEQQWEDDSILSRQHPYQRPSLTIADSFLYTTIAATKESFSSRSAPAKLPQDYIQSTKVYKRNDFVYFIFILNALYSLLIGIGSLLLVVGGGSRMLLAMLLVSITVYLVWSAGDRHYYSTFAPLKFLPVLIVQSCCVCILVIRWQLGESSEQVGLIVFQLVVYGWPWVVFCIYEVILLLRSAGIQWVKKAIPHYYVYLNLAL